MLTIVNIVECLPLRRTCDRTFVCIKRYPRRIGLKKIYYEYFRLGLKKIYFESYEGRGTYRLEFFVD